jgi:outer membrane protein OmpA-like peptidoglycan-associated protein
MRRIAIVCLFILAFAARAQQADTLIYAEGRILNKTTKELVPASISYQSLPYGNIVGQMKGSSYRFPFYTQDRYEIIVEAAGFAPAKYMLDPGQANGERKVVQDVELGLSAGASIAAETAHSAGVVMTLENLIFQQGLAKIEEGSYDELDKVVSMMQNYPKMVIQLEGHTDIQGDPKRNMTLSEQRVDAVKKYLISKGIKQTRVKTKAFGGTQPLSRENTEEAHKMNRRVQVRILKN